MVGLGPVEKIFEDAIEFLREEVYPRANEIDRSVDVLHSALDEMCARELMALRRPVEYGGPAFPQGKFQEFLEAVARYSGSLAFLQSQQQSAVVMIAESENEALKQRLLPKMGNGERMIGIGFSQLRRPGPPILTATKTSEGYLLEGSVPWVTGYTLYHDFLIGASLQDGRAVFGIVPFSKTKRGNGSISFTKPMRLAAMESPQTVSAKLVSFLLPDEDVAFIKPTGWIQNNDMINITLQGTFALGCAQAGLDQVFEAYERRNAEFVLDAYRSLNGELADCRHQMVESQSSDDDRTTQEKLHIRAWAIDLAVRCAQAGVAANSGASNSVDHPAQRIYREALVFTVSAQTTDVMRATLARLVGRGTV